MPFLLPWKSGIILSSEENLSLSETTLGKQVGGGVVSTCSYEARAFGVHSAMSSKEAYERCPQAVFISGNYEKYKAVGLQIRAIFKRYTDLIEPMSIDEAYLDVTENKLGIKSAVKIARLIQEDIWQELHLTASAGVFL